MRERAKISHRVLISPPQSAIILFQKNAELHIFITQSENLTERKARKNKKISATTIKRYIDYLEDSFLTDSAIRYDIKGKEIYKHPFKILLFRLMTEKCETEFQASRGNSRHGKHYFQ